MVYEDNFRNDELENLQKRSEMLETKWNETSKREKQLQLEVSGKDYTIECFSTKEECYKHKIKCLEEKMAECKDSVSKWEIKLEHQLTRETQLENEVLAHVKANSQMEQEMTLLYNTIETLKRNNHSCNEQRANVQKELDTAKKTILDFESQIIDDNLGSSLKKDLAELEKKYAFSEEQRLRLQDEIFSMKDKMLRQNGQSYNSDSSIYTQNGTMEIQQHQQQYHEILNNKSKSSSIIHHKQNESVVLHTDENEQLVYKAIQSRQVLSSDDLEVYVGKKQEEVQTLVDEKQRYQDECTLLLEEVECLKENCQILESRLDERSEYIDGLAEECSLLNDNIRTRNIVITKQEDEIESLQEQLGSITQNVEKQPGTNSSELTTKELTERNQQIAQLQSEVEHLQQQILHQQQQNQHHCHQHCETKTLQQLKDENFQKELTVKTLEKRISLLEDREQQNLEGEFQLEGYITEVAENDQDQTTEEPEEETTKLRRRIQCLESESQRINELLQSSEHNNNDGIDEHAIDDYSFENEHLISKQKYSEAVESVKTKEQIIEDLKEHISLLENELQINNNSSNSNNRSTSTPISVASSSQQNKTREETIAGSPRLGLRLPSPDIVPNYKGHTFTAKRNSLPPLPGGVGINSRPESTRRSESATDDTMREVRAETAIDDMRGKIIKLNADLLEKKMLLNQVEEELRVMKRKYGKLEAMHR